MPPYRTTLGTPLHHPVLPVPTPALAHHEVTTLWAQARRSLWVGGREASRVLRV